jgi:hypothetical protein
VLATTIKTTATRRLAITDLVGHIGAGDPVETLTIPAGMTFTTADPLPELISLTVLGKLTATGAKLAQVTDLNVAGELVAASALYTGLTTLTVSGTFATAQALSGLTALTVEGPLGNFSAPSVAGAGTGDDAGITLAVNAGGTATITGVIGNLKLGTIAGTLTTAANFTPLTPSGGTSTASPLSALAGAVINGVPFTAETTEVIALADNAVTTGNFAVSASQALRIPANEGITTPTTLTIAAGSTFTYNGQVTLATTTGTGSLVLASGATGAKIAGTGTITAGATVITGNWEATGTTDGILTILSATTGATITATSGATGLKASAAGAAIVQGTANLNFLVIGVGTTIDLAGTINAKVGEIILTAGTNPGALKLTADDPNGARITANAGTGATQIGGVTTVTIDSKTVTFAQIAKTTFLLETGTQFSSVKAGTSDDATITAHTSGDNASINSTAIAEGAD